MGSLLNFNKIKKFKRKESMNGKLRLSRVYSSIRLTTWTEIPNQN